MQKQIHRLSRFTLSDRVCKKADKRFVSDGCRPYDVLCVTEGQSPTPERLMLVKHSRRQEKKCVGLKVVTSGFCDIHVQPGSRSGASTTGC